MYFAGSPFEQPSSEYYQTDTEYMAMTDAEKCRFTRSFIGDTRPITVSIRTHTVILNDTININIPVSRFAKLRSMYLAANLININHMYLCIAFVYTAYKFCKNYITFMLAKYPYISRVRAVCAGEVES